MRLVRLGALVAATLALSVAGLAAPISYGSIGDIIAGTGNITIGDKTFSDFATSGIATSDVNVLGSVAADGTVEIIFQGSFVDVAGGSTSDYGLFYSVMAGPGFVISGITQAFTLSGGGDVSIGESVWQNDYFSGLVASSTLAVNGSITDVEDPEAEVLVQGDDLTVPDLTKVYVTKDLHFTASDAGGEVGATLVKQGFVQTGDLPQVPEPTTMLLFSSALLGLGFIRKIKKS